MRARSERGTAALEFVILTPLLLVAMLFVVGLGRMAHSKQQLESVAGDSARAASLERDPGAAKAVAKQAAEETLGNVGLVCASLKVKPDMSNYRPGGSITVQVSCTAELSDIAMAGFPGKRTFQAQNTVPIETWRQE